MMKTVAVVLLALGSLGVANGACHGAHCSVTQNPDIVDNAITNVELHYNDDLCLEILLIDCAKYVTAGDEVICASNGHTYPDHCHFAHARCEFYINHHGGHTTDLTVVHTGSCSPTTVATTTSGAVTTMASTVAATTGGAVTTMASGTSTTMAAVSGMSTNGMATAGMTGMTTTTDVPSTTMMMTTTQMPATTDPVSGIIQGVFCQQVDNINCNTGFKIVCATNGQFYPNECELSKAKCKDPALTIDPDSTNCTV